MDAISFESRAAGIRERVALQGFMHLVGAQIDDLAPGSSTISVMRRDDLLQQHGLFHGGVTAFLIDNGTTIAAATILKAGQGVLTAEYKLNLLSPADGERLICRSRVVKPGSRMIVVVADVFTEKDGREKQTAVALAHRAEKWSRFSAPNDAPLKGLSIGLILKVQSTFRSNALATIAVLDQASMPPLRQAG